MNEILDQLRTTFSTTFGSTFLTYFKGEIRSPAIDDMPILTVIPISTAQEHSGTLRDKVVYTIAVEVQISVKQYLDNSAGQGTQLDTLDALIDHIEQRESDGDLQTDTVMGIINANLTVTNKVLFTDNMKVDYEQYLLDNKFPVAKARVTFEATDRPNRT